MVTIETIEKELADYRRAARDGFHGVAGVHASMLAFYAVAAIKERDSALGDAAKLIENERSEK